MSAMINSDEQQMLVSSTHIAKKSNEECFRRRKQGILRKAQSCKNFPVIPALTVANEKQGCKRSRGRARRVNTIPSREDRWVSQSHSRNVSADVAPSNLVRRVSSGAEVDERCSESDTIRSQGQHVSIFTATEAPLPAESNSGTSRWDSDKNCSGDTSSTPMLDSPKQVQKRARSLQPPKLPCRKYSALAPPVRVSSYSSVA